MISTLQETETERLESSFWERSQPNLAGHFLTAKSGKVYVLGAKIANGGQADVYQGFHLRTRETVAVKVSSPIFESWMQKEALALCSTDHPNLVRVIDCGITQDQSPFLVLDFIKGKTLKDYRSERPHLPVKVAVGLGLQIASALQHLHYRGWIHRDIKPTNVMVTAHDDGSVDATLIDCGITRNIIDRHCQATTAFTPGYCPPEVLLGAANDFRSDIFQLGLTIFECVFGTKPNAEQENEPSWLSGNQEKTVNALCPGLGTLLRECLYCDPKRRPQTMRYVVLALSRILHGFDYLQKAG